MATFLVFGNQSVNLDHVARAEWKPTPDGRDAAIFIHNGGHVHCCPVADPNIKPVAEALGFGKHLEAWPKVKAAADQKYQKELADRQARTGGRRLQPA